MTENLTVHVTYTCNPTGRIRYKNFKLKPTGLCREMMSQKQNKKKMSK